MLNKAVFRDKRLRGNLPLVDSWRSFQLDGETSLALAFAFLDSLVTAKGGKLDKLCLLCHGIGNREENEITGEDKFWGGFGLQLGAEGVKVGTVNLWSNARNKVRDIIVYSCSVAETTPGRENQTGDGGLLMRQLADTTNANVYASEHIQYYYTDDMDFGYWEGNLLRFKPGGEVTQVSNFMFN